ncbi:uncharacterized protein KY384_008570 [Bacidia gigantensis]|uniref:uncharacterized protein n=1 Tax=Bacidia gigantensis TaxID=2732470 RepID=UPI001D037DD5|nr:uncharacterized protein KY384_008570 [Bacidia gigantensis]KAG8527141.1 hypothetical protein KY384_008570 [Bacidia gigantensis]
MSSDGSAYFGEPPLSSGDVTIMKGLFGSTKPPKRVPVPPGEPKTAAPGLVVGLSFAIVIVVFITGARLLTRIFRKGQVFGWDDWIVIPGVGIALAYFANLLVRTQTGCAGKHMNDCTYKELGVFTTIVNNIFLGILILFFFITLFINIFQCSPVTAFFNYAIKVDSPTYHCLDTGKISNAFSIINCALIDLRSATDTRKT